MLGFLIGTACLVGLIRTVRGGRCGYGGYRRYGWGGRRAALRFLFERLDTSPGQEKVIMAALEELWSNKREIREEIEQSRQDIARAMQSPVFDASALEEAFARHDRVQARLRESVKHALSTVHEALDDNQRKIAAELIEHGFGRGFARGGCGRWRGHGHHPGGGSDAQGPYRSATYYVST